MTASTAERPVGPHRRRCSPSTRRADAIEFERRVAHVGRAGRRPSTQVAALVDRPGRRGRRPAAQPPGARSALLLGVLRAGGCVVTINPGRGRRAHPRRHRRPRPRRCSSASPTTSPSWCRTASARPRVARRPTSASRSWSTRGAGTTRRRGRPGVAVRMLTSGTTGPPKRIDLTYETFERVLVGAKHYESNRDADARACARASPSSTRRWSTSAGCSGCCSASPTAGRSRCSSGSPSTAGSTPCAATARPPPASCPPRCAWCSRPTSTPPTSRSLRSVVSGTAPLDPDDADAFIRAVRRARARSPTPPPSSAAASPAGTSPTTAQFWATKRGSVGRAHAGCELRVVDPETRRARSAPTPRGCSR